MVEAAKWAASVRLATGRWHGRRTPPWRWGCTEGFRPPPSKGRTARNGWWRSISLTAARAAAVIHPFLLVEAQCSGRTCAGVGEPRLPGAFAPPPPRAGGGLPSPRRARAREGASRMSNTHPRQDQGRTTKDYL